MTIKELQKKNVNKVLNKHTPTLRFPNFSDDWEEKKLGEVADVKGGKRIPKGYSLQSNKNNYPYITVSDMGNKSINLGKIKYVPENVFEKIKKYIISTKDIYISVAGTLGLIGIIPKELDGANLTENADKLTNLKCDQKFLLHYLSGDSLKKLINSTKTVGAQPKLAVYVLQNMKIKLPSLPEQEKIASFLGGVDDWLGNLKEQKEELEKYKKGIMQQIFPAKDSKTPTLRFPDFTGDWEEKKLGEVGKTYNGLTGKTKEDFGVGEKFIAYKQIFDKNEIDVEKCPLVNILENEMQNEAQYGDVFFTTSSETPLEVGYSSVLLSRKKGIYLNSFSFGFRPNLLDELNPEFSKFFFRNSYFRKDVVRLAQGSTRYNMSKVAFMKIKTKLPSFPEQEKIASFLTSIDDIIESTEQKIAALEKWKKGLMQKMFV